jgi:16S rRNA (cytidine1402-2'-O)-methyltransferase
LTDETGTDSAAEAAAAAAARMSPVAVEPGMLYVVSTPIGHLGDISLRALQVLQTVDRILCEDTRHAHTLLARYGIRTPTVALHEHNEARMVPLVLEQLREGAALALISDAGTPLVSDPGERLVSAVAEATGRVVPVPGASAALAALVGSGLPAHPSTILGFLPRKGKEREAMLRWASHCPHSVVLYESPNRLADTLSDLADIAGTDRPAVVARELTKRFEEFRRGTLATLAAYYSESPPRGEIVIVLSAAPAAVAPTEDSLRDTVRALRADGLAPRAIMTLLMEREGVARNLAYRLAHDP